MILNLAYLSECEILESTGNISADHTDGIQHPICYASKIIQPGIKDITSNSYIYWVKNLRNPVTK